MLALDGCQCPKNALQILLKSYLLSSTITIIIYLVECYYLSQLFFRCSWHIRWHVIEKGKKSPQLRGTFKP